MYPGWLFWVIFFGGIAGLMALIQLVKMMVEYAIS